MKDLFTAAREGDIHSLRVHLEQKPDLSAQNEYGFTVLHCLAMGANNLPKDVVLEALALLLQAGSPLNAASRDGRTPLYLMAEFTRHIEPVQALLDAGAEADVSDSHGNHIIENAMLMPVKELLSHITGKPVPKPKKIHKPVQLKAAAWKKAQVDLDSAFTALSDAGLIALQDVGTTQSDGFDDCSQLYQERLDKESIKGFCFYTRQDLSRAKRTAELSLAIWGAPQGDEKSTVLVGNLLREIFEQKGLEIQWSGKSTDRPAIYLDRYSA
jgi:bifunctional non-homologous end joining protein LigD